MLRVSLTNRQKQIRVDRALMRKVAQAAAPPDWQDACLSVVIVGDEEIGNLNRRFLDKSEPTDVLAFPLDGPDGSDRPTVGEVIISAERAASVAKTRGVPVEEELALYVAHGVLHLCGHDDMDPDSRRRMRRRERDILAEFGMSRPYRGRPGG